MWHNERLILPINSALRRPCINTLDGPSLIYGIREDVNKVMIDKNKHALSIIQNKHAFLIIQNKHAFSNIKNKHAFSNI